jgi:hypothetical protein
MIKVVKFGKLQKLKYLALFGQILIIFQEEMN